MWTLVDCGHITHLGNATADSDSRGLGGGGYERCVWVDITRTPPTYGKLSHRDHQNALLSQVAHNNNGQSADLEPISSETGYGRKKCRLWHSKQQQQQQQQLHGF
jgi:hypothetical protein